MNKATTGKLHDTFTKIRRRIAPPWRLATRLALGFSIASILLLMITSAFPYFALSTNMNREDNDSLKAKASELAVKLSSEDGMKDHSGERDDSEDAQDSEPIFVRVLRQPDGLPVSESPQMSRLAPTSVFPLPSNYPFNASAEPVFVDMHAHKRRLRLLAATVTNPSHQTFLIQLALDRTPEAELLEFYGNSLAALLMIGLVGAGVAGYLIAWRGLRPVRRMADAVADIGSSTLHRRLDTNDVPPELASLADAFNAMLARLEDAFARISGFSSDIAHELRTPVNNVRGMVELTLSQAQRPESERAEQLSRALDECGRLSKLIDSMLFLARAENPKTQLQQQELDLRNLLQTIHEFYEPLAGDNGIALQLGAPAPVPARGDRLLLQRALANLVENAIVHTPRGGTITLTAFSESGAAIIRVSDTGPGIPPEQLDRIFDRLHRLDFARSKHTGGAGIGLAIVRGILTMHGGTAEAANAPAGGATFTLRLPVTSPR